MSHLPSHTSSEDAHAHPRHAGLRWFDLSTAVTALVISGVSLFVGIEHADTTRRLVDGNTWPFLQQSLAYDAYGTGKTAFFSSIGVANQGVGPAKIEDLVVRYRGTPFRTYDTLLAACCGLSADDSIRPQQTPNGVGIGSPLGTVLRPGESVSLIEVRRPHDTVGTSAARTLAQAFDRATADITFSACYCSVFDNCWRTDLKTLHPKPVKSCSADPQAWSSRP